MHTHDTHTDLINALITTEKLLTQLHAAQLRLLATLAGSRDSDPIDCTEEETTAALRWSPTTTRTRPHTAETLTTHFPETLHLMAPANSRPPKPTPLDAHAKPRTPGDERTLDQRRADTLTHLALDSMGVPLNGTAQVTSQVPALVQVAVGIDTLLGGNEKPAELRGIGPITAGQARQIAFGRDATWHRLLTTPDGQLLHTDPRTHKPTASVARLVRLRDRHRTFPGYAIPTARCDLDHITPFDHTSPQNAGATTPQNPHALRRRHHRLKTAGSWKVTRNGGGEVVWSAPTGHRYVTRAEAYAA